jgi:hypothetical protein
MLSLPSARDWATPKYIAGLRPEVPSSIVNCNSPMIGKLIAKADQIDFGELGIDFEQE